MRLSVVIPAWNEEKTLATTLNDIDGYLTKQPYNDYEIIIVNDGSKDRTAEIVRSLMPKIKGLRLIDHEVNKGKAGVVVEGLLDAKGDYRLFMDADNATSIKHLTSMWPKFEDGCDVVIGTRDEKDAKGASQAVRQPFFKRTLGNVGNVIVQIVAVPGIWDTQCGFKAFTAKAAEDILSRVTCISGGVNAGWWLDVEILAVARKLGYKVGIVPVYWVNNPASRVNIKGYIRTFIGVFRVRWNLIRGIYGKKV